MNIYAISSLIFLGMGILNIILGGLTINTHLDQTFIMSGSGVAFLIIGIIIVNIAPKKYQRESQSFGDVIRQ